jgi:hypothetical protein
VIPNSLITLVSRTRPWFELAVASTSGLLSIVTIFWRDWIEALTGADPDQHSGVVEWGVVLALAVLAGFLAMAARRDFRRLSRA